MSTSFNFDAVIANLVQENGLAPVLKDYLSSGGTLSAVLDRLDGYTNLNTSKQEYINGCMKSMRLGLLLQRYQLDPESTVDPKDIKELTLEIHSHFENGEDEEFWIPSRIFLSAAKRMADAIGSNRVPDYTAMSRNDPQAREHEWCDTEWFDSGRATPVPSILTAMSLPGDDKTTIPATVPTHPPVPAAQLEKPAEATGSESFGPLPTRPGVPATALDKPVEATGSVSFEPRRLLTGPLASGPLLAPAPVRIRGSAGAAAVGSKRGPGASDDASVRRRNVPPGGPSTSTRSKASRIKSAALVESDDDAEVKQGDVVIPAPASKRKADGPPTAESERPTIRIKKPRPATANEQPVTTPPSHPQTCVRCQNAQEVCEKYPNGEACLRCKRLKTRCSLITVYRPRAKPGEGKQKKRSKKGIKGESPIPVDTAMVVTSSTPPGGQPIAGPSTAPYPSQPSGNIKLESPPPEVVSVKKRKPSKRKNLAALVPDPVPVPVVVPPTPAPPNPDLAVLHQTVVRVDVLEAQNYELHQANTRLGEENEALRGMVETLRRHVLEVSSTVDHLQGLVLQRPARSGSPDSMVGRAQDVTNIAIQTDAPSPEPRRFQEDVPPRVVNEGHPEALVEPPQAQERSEEVPRTVTPQPPSADVEMADPGGLVGAQEGPTAAEDGEPGVPEPLAIPVHPPSEGRPDDFQQPGAGHSPHTPSGPPPFPSPFLTSTPLFVTPSRPRTPVEPGNATQYILRTHQTPSDAGNTSWDERMHLDPDLDPHPYLSGSAEQEVGHPHSEWNIDGMLAATTLSPQDVNFFSTQPPPQLGQAEPMFDTICPQVLQPTNPLENSGIEITPSLIPDIAHLPHSDSSSNSLSPFL